MCTMYITLGTVYLLCTLGTVCTVCTLHTVCKVCTVNKVCTFCVVHTLCTVCTVSPGSLYSQSPDTTVQLYCFQHVQCQPFTKPPLFQRNRLTGSGNPLFESCVEGKAQKREIQVYSRRTYQIPHDSTFLKRHS